MSEISDVAVGNTIQIPKAPNITHGGRYYAISRVTALVVEGALANGKRHDIPFAELDDAFQHQTKARAVKAKAVLQQPVTRMQLQALG